MLTLLTRTKPTVQKAALMIRTPLYPCNVDHVQVSKQVLLINPRCRRYDAKFTAPMKALTSGTPPPVHERAAGAIFQCLRPAAQPFA